MGLNKDNGGNAMNKLHVKRNAICLESSKEIEGYEYVSGEVDGRPYEKWIQKHGSVDGMITGIEWYDTADQFEARYQGLHVGIDDGKEQYVLELPYATKPYDAFSRFAENIDFTKPVEFCAWYDRAKDSTGFCAKQDGQVIRQKYTKKYIEENTDCPPAVENKRTGKLNFDEQRDWLLENILENIAPKIKKSTAADTVVHAEPKAKRASASSAAEEDHWVDKLSQ
jgi:hypothetical protein